MHGVPNFQDMSNEVLLTLAKQRVPEIPVNRITDCNRDAVIAVLKITEQIRQRRIRQGIERAKPEVNLAGCDFAFIDVSGR